MEQKRERERERVSRRNRAVGVRITWKQMEMNEFQRRIIIFKGDKKSRKLW